MSDERSGLHEVVETLQRQLHAVSAQGGFDENRVSEVAINLVPMIPLLNELMEEADLDNDMHEPTESFIDVLYHRTAFDGSVDVFTTRRRPTRTTHVQPMGVTEMAWRRREDSSVETDP